MSDITEPEGEPRPKPNPYEQFIARADAAGFGVKRIAEGLREPHPILSVGFPNGRDTRQIQIGSREVKALLQVDFESIRFLGDYSAILLPETSSIEAVVRSPSLPRSLLVRRLLALPRDAGSASAGQQIDPDDEDVFVGGSPTSVSVRVESQDRWIEISNPSPTAAALFRGRPYLLTLKTPIESAASSDEALAQLEARANSFFFDLDVRYGLALELQRERRRQLIPLVERSAEPPVYPLNEYPSAALELYRYGRSARGLPLLEFLAYYQVIEYFFPYFSEQATISALRTELLSPAFSRLDDSFIRRIISLSRPNARGVLSEKAQLRSTIESCVDGASLRAFIEASAAMRDHFCANKQNIPGLRKLQLTSDQDLRHQVADRLYDLRCRIVHTKSDGGETEVELLLPASDDVQWLGPDIELAKLVAQRAIVARSHRSEAL